MMLKARVSRSLAPISPRLLCLMLALVGAAHAAEQELPLYEQIGEAEAVAAPLAQAWRILWPTGNQEPGYQSHIVIEDGHGLLRQAWICTGDYDSESGPEFDFPTYQRQESGYVIYGATAYIDAAGRLHVDAYESQVLGPRARSEDARWIPDSFLVHESGRILIIDDLGKTSPNPDERRFRQSEGRLSDIWFAQPGGPERLVAGQRAVPGVQIHDEATTAYEQMRTLIRVLIEGTL